MIEAQVEQGRGPTATVIVRIGTLQGGRSVHLRELLGQGEAVDRRYRQADEGGRPATPVKVLGFTGLPNAGDELVVMESERDANASARSGPRDRNSKLAAPQRATLENLFASIAEGQKPTSANCPQGRRAGFARGDRRLARARSANKKIDLDIIHVGGRPDHGNDVLLASASNAVIIGFSVKVENNAAPPSAKAFRSSSTPSFTS